jgi:hypothetical protein
MLFVIKSSKKLLPYISMINRLDTVYKKQLRIGNEKEGACTLGMQHKRVHKFKNESLVYFRCWYVFRKFIATMKLMTSITVYK